MSLAIAFLPVFSIVSVVVFGFFAGVGAYVILARHRAVRLINRTFLAASAVFALSAVALAGINGSLMSDFRWTSYAAYYLCGAVFFAGWVHFRNPLRQAVLGARIGVVLASIASVAEVLAGADRVGFGSNQANAAFVIAAIAILTRIRVPAAPRPLGNSRAWFYLAVIPMMLTGTRSTLPLIGICVILDLAAWLRARQPSRRVVVALAAALAFVVLVPAIAIMSYHLPLPDAVERTRIEYRAMMENPLDHDNGLSIRLVLWDHAWQVIRTRPWTGYGGVASMALIKADIPANGERFESFIHVHNLIMDELRIRGVIGLVLHLGFFIFVFSQMYRRGNADIRQNVLTFAFWMVVYGSFHGLLQADRNIMVVTIYITLVLASIDRNRFARRPDDRDVVTATGIRRSQGAS
ncbi:O-antigen ligase [Hoeflea marina]|uniref:O-antigen ligase n=1 Tax=Hoeflea marina TaxID=274592 RepID=A0A317PDK9_9HYPH|nr:O-antigen ligase family protein [Hoeflea marina]PWV97629.1 O-antigen ligase [Hoeflea marina]